MNDFASKYDSIIQDPLLRNYYGEKDFYNVGYWLLDTLNQQEACENLMEKLLEFIPEKKGTILDVACGLGATTSHLLKYYSPVDIVGINISTKQLERSRVNAPGCNFILMDAAQLEFEDDLFDNIISVEAAFHFDTRERFLQEAWRVLKPGGNLVLSDIIFESTQWVGDWLVPQKNNVKDTEEYKDVYVKSGFQQVELVDKTNQTWGEYCRHVMLWLREKFLAGKLDEPTFHEYMTVFDGLLNSSVRHYLLVSAKKV
ncbi:class I SAM-dependent methyltransferase [Nostoc flagelliforme]|nr:class I SAM-dependent methyltransferase [Nostoc flagelliforme]